VRSGARPSVHVEPSRRPRGPVRAATPRQSSDRDRRTEVARSITVHVDDARHGSIRWPTAPEVRESRPTGSTGRRGARRRGVVRHRGWSIKLAAGVAGEDCGARHAPAVECSPPPFGQTDTSSKRCRQSRSDDRPGSVRSGASQGSPHSGRKLPTVDVGSRSSSTPAGAARDEGTRPCRDDGGWSGESGHVEMLPEGEVADAGRRPRGPAGARPRAGPGPRSPVATTWHVEYKTRPDRAKSGVAESRIAPDGRRGRRGQWPARASAGREAWSVQRPEQGGSTSTGRNASRRLAGRRPHRTSKQGKEGSERTVRKKDGGKVDAVAL